MTATSPAASRQAVVDAALVLLERMGLTPADLAAVPQHRPEVPTFAEYVSVVSAAVSAGTRRAYGSYWNRVIEHWGDRRLDEPTPSEIRQLMVYVKTHVVARRNARGGRSAEEHLVAALRCLYKRAVDDGLITEADNPARKVAKPRRLPTTRRALPDNRLAQINNIAATTGDDPELDTLSSRSHKPTSPCTEVIACSGMLASSRLSAPPMLVGVPDTIFAVLSATTIASVSPCSAPIGCLRDDETACSFGPQSHGEISRVIASPRTSSLLPSLLVPRELAGWKAKACKSACSSVTVRRAQSHQLRDLPGTHRSRMLCFSTLRVAV